MNNVKILVAIIAYNEAESICDVVEDIRTNLPEADIVIIDDHSSDDTMEKGRAKGVPVIRHAVNLGTAGFTSVYTSLLYAERCGYDVCCQFDGDGQHDGRYLKTIIAPVLAGEADLVVGSRFLDEISFRSTFARRMGVRLFSVITSLLIGQRILDVTSGFKAYGRQAIQLFGRKYQMPPSDTNEILIVTHYAGGKIKEVPVRMRERQFGSSSINLYKAFAFPVRAGSFILGLYLQKNMFHKMKIFTE